MVVYVRGVMIQQSRHLGRAASDQMIRTSHPSGSRRQPIEIGLAPDAHGAPETGSLLQKFGPVQNDV